MTKYQKLMPLKLLEVVANRDFADKIFPSIKVKVTQSQFDAMVSLAYNIGAGAFLKSTLLKKVNAGDFAGAGEEFLRWNKESWWKSGFRFNKKKKERKTTISIFS